MIYDGERPGERNTFADLERVVRRTTRDLRPHLDEFDAIAVTGVSGDSVGFPVALRLRKPIVSVRKESGQHHQWDGGDVAGYQGLPENARVLFLDDFVASGATRGRVERALGQLKGNPRLVGQYMYHGWVGAERKGELVWAGPTGLPRPKYGRGS